MVHTTARHTSSSLIYPGGNRGSLSSIIVLRSFSNVTPFSLVYAHPHSLAKLSISLRKEASWRGPVQSGPTTAIELTSCKKHSYILAYFLCQVINSSIHKQARKGFLRSICIKFSNQVKRRLMNQLSKTRISLYRFLDHTQPRFVDHDKRKQYINC